MARGTRADATRHARPRGRAARAHVSRRWRTGPGHTAGGHADARVGRHMADGWLVKGPWVSGPWLEYWGSNAIALNRPPILPRYVLLFPPCGTKVPRSLTFAGHVAAPRTLDLQVSTEKRRYDGLEVHSIANHNTCV